MSRYLSAALTVAIAVGVWALPNVVSAQDEIQKRENVSYFRVVHLNFKPGHNQAAWAIMYEKIAPAVRATGRDFIALDWASLNEQEGGEEAGQKVWDEWQSHIDSSSQAVAHMHLPPADDE
jgi:hypothetical protein